MFLYEVRYWSEGPGRSHVEVVLVAAKTKKDAIKFVCENCGVYKNDQPYVTATRSGSTKSILVKHLREEY